MNELIERLTAYIDGKYHNVFEYDSKKLKRIIGYVRDMLEKAMKGETCRVSSGDTRNIVLSLGAMIETLVRKIADTEDEQFIRDYNVLCFNLANAYNVGEIQAQCETLDILLQYKNSMRAQLELMKLLLKYVERYNKFNPPAFEISKSYLANLSGRISEK